MVKKKNKKAKPSPDKKPAESSSPQIDQDKLNITPYPTAGQRVTEFENKLDEVLQPETKRGPGRPRKTDAAIEDKPDAPIELVAGAVKMPFELWTISQGIKELSLTDAESQQLAEPVKQLLDYYLPMIPPIGYAWGALAVSVFWTMKSRLNLIRELKQKDLSSASGSAAQQGPAGSPVPAGGRKNGFPNMQEVKPQQL